MQVSVLEFFLHNYQKPTLGRANLKSVLDDFMLYLGCISNLGQTLYTHHIIRFSHFLPVIPARFKRESIVTLNPSVKLTGHLLYGLPPN